MTAKKVFATLFILSFTFIYAQQYTLKGKVTDTEKNPLEFASVSIEDPDSHEQFIEDFTDENGNFSVSVDEGRYLVFIEAFSGNTAEQIIDVNGNTDLGIFEIKEETIALEGVEITGDSQVYNMELDRKVYNVAQDPQSKGRSISEALENVPSVQVDGEGNVSLRGNENVRILVDGKPSSLIGTSDPAQALQSLPSEIVDRIEVITNPSAKYDAEGSAGILNIILKKGKLKGLNGSFNLSGGIPTSYGASANLNYRKEKWNFFTSLGYRHSKWERKTRSSTTRFDSDGIPSYEEKYGDPYRTGNNYNFMLGAEYFLDDKNTFTLSGNYSKRDGNNISDLHYEDFNSNHEQTAFSTRSEREDSKRYSVEGNFGYKHEFEGSGHELTIDAVGNYSESDSNSDLREIGDIVDSRERSFNERDNYRASLTADYAYPFAEKSKLELGAKAEWTGNLTDFKVDSLAGSEWHPKDKFATRTDYKQNVYAAYAQFGQGFGSFSYFAGLRMENSDITVNSVLDNTVVKKDYTDFFPSLFLNYEFDYDNQLQLSYSRRIRRPRAWFLIPITSYSDNRNIFMGNPELDPQYTDAYELSYVTKIGKLMLTPNIYFSQTHDNIQRYQTLDPEGVIISRPVNAGTDNRYGGDLTFSYRPWAWWNIMGNVNLFGYKTKGEHTDEFINPDSGEVTTRTTNFNGNGFSWFGRISNNFTLPAKFNVQLSAFYRAGSKTTQMERKPMYGFDLSLNKDFWHDDATLTISVRDLFNTRSFKSSSFGDNFFMDSESRWGGRSINLTLSYRLNQTKRDQRRKARENMDMDMDMEGEGGMM